jgi:hypothetical protein
MRKPFSKVVLEASFARVHQHTRNRNIGMMLASRDNLTSEKSRQRHAALKNDVRKARYGFIDVKGRYVDVMSLLVVGKKGRQINKSKLVLGTPIGLANSIR